MLDDTSAPARRQKQIPVRLTTCQAGCGATVAYRTNAKVSCAACKVSRKRESMRLAAERQRRKHGIPQIKGTLIDCAICARPFERSQIRSKYCPSCAPEHYAEKSRQFAKAKHATQEGKDYLNAWFRNKRRTDPAWAINASMSTLIHRCLKGGKAGRSWTTLVPYSLADLVRHLERQFTGRMSWKNRGKWHVDHIQALSSFKFASAEDPEFQAA
jgi:hypothetical protein